MNQHETLVLIRQFASVQQRISSHVQMLNRQVADLQSELMQARAQHVLAVSRIAWRTAVQDTHAPEQCQTRMPAASEHLVTIQALRAAIPIPAAGTAKPWSVAEKVRTTISTLTAEVLICQSGCLSQDAYWRVKEACRRLGKRCIFVAPDEVETILEHELRK